MAHDVVGDGAGAESPETVTRVRTDDDGVDAELARDIADRRPRVAGLDPFIDTSTRERRRGACERGLRLVDLLVP